MIELTLKEYKRIRREWLVDRCTNAAAAAAFAGSLLLVALRLLGVL